MIERTHDATIEELRALLAEQDEVIRNKADEGHVAAKYWGRLMTERKRVRQMRGDVEKWQEMYREAHLRAERTSVGNPGTTHADVVLLARWFADQGWSAHELLGPIEKPWHFLDEIRAARAIGNAIADAE